MEASCRSNASVTTTRRIARVRDSPRFESSARSSPPTGLPARPRRPKRREIDFGRVYDRRCRKFVARTELVPPILAELRSLVATAIGIKAETFGQIITARYVPDAAIHWHCDNTDAFSEPICGVSLGASCDFKLSRHPTGKQSWTFRLEPRSLYVLGGPARWDYFHHIPKVDRERYSVTLRPLAVS